MAFEGGPRDGKRYWQQVADKNNRELNNRIQGNDRTARTDIVWLASESGCYLDWKRGADGYILNEKR